MARLKIYTAQRSYRSTCSRLHGGRNFSGKSAVRRAQKKSARRQGRQVTEEDLLDIEEARLEEAKQVQQQQRETEEAEALEADYLDDYLQGGRYEDYYPYEDDWDSAREWEDQPYREYEETEQETVRDTFRFNAHLDDYDWDEDPDFHDEQLKIAAPSAFDIVAWRRRKS